MSGEKFLDNLGDLPGGDTLEIHLGDGGTEGIVKARPVVEGGDDRMEAALTGLRDVNVNLAGRGQNGAFLIAVAVVDAIVRAVVLLTAEVVILLSSEACSTISRKASSRTAPAFSRASSEVRCSKSLKMSANVVCLVCSVMMVSFCFGF